MLRSVRWLRPRLGNQGRARLAALAVLGALAAVPAAAQAQQALYFADTAYAGGGNFLAAHPIGADGSLGAFAGSP
jgi:hypothetical protein